MVAYIAPDLSCAGVIKIALYTVLLCAVDGDILLLPDRGCNVENARPLLPVILCASVAINIPSSPVAKPHFLENLTNFFLFLYL